MAALADILAWIGEQESVLSGIAACIVIVGVLFSPLGAGIRRVVRGREADAGEVIPVESAPVLPTRVTDRPSIAVMPFESGSGDPEELQLAAGLTRDITTALSRVKPFFVVAGNAMRSAPREPTDVQTVSHELGVRYVLEGSVRTGAERVRVGVELIDAETRAHTWAESYERALGDPFALQDELRTAIVAALQPELRRVEAEHARRSAPEELSAWRLVNRAWVAVQSDLGSHDAAAAAATSCARALELDPDYALAHAVLGHARSLVAAQQPDPPAARDEALGHARRGLALGADDPLVQHCYAATMGNLGRTREGILAFERSLELDPNSAQALAGLGIAQIFVGEHRDALQNIDRALALSPRDPLRYHWIAHRAMTLMLLGRLDEAVASARDSVARADSVIGWATLATCLGRLGEPEEGRRAVRELQRVSPELGLDLWRQLLRSVTSSEEAEALIDGMVAAAGDLA